MFDRIVVALAILSAVYGVWRSRKKQLTAPGPPADPLLGHLRLLPTKDLEIFFYELGKKYGDIVGLNLLGDNILVVNSIQVVEELLNKRGANYSNRPPLPFASLMDMGDLMLLLGYNEDLHMQRRIFQQYLSKHALQDNDLRLSWQAHAIDAAKSLLQASGSTDWDKHLIFYSTSIIIAIISGHRMKPVDDPYVEISHLMAHEVIPAMRPEGGSIIELFPSLIKLPSWIPNSPIVKNAIKGRVHVNRLRKFPYEEVRKQLDDGTAKPSLLASLIANAQNGSEALTSRQIEAIASSIYLGGFETTSSSLAVFAAAMILHPECQARAQEEIERVVGSDRLPEFCDRESLPYVEGVMQEVLRWRPIVPTGIPHVSNEDDVYGKYFIPKGTTIIPNVRGMSLDESVYRDPLNFDPTRFLPAPEGRGEPHFQSAFGFGRRICPGRFLADDTFWIAMVTILATITVQKPLDEHGVEYDPDIQFEMAISCRPRAFPCRFIPRNAKVQRTLEQASVVSEAAS